MLYILYIAVRFMVLKCCKERKVINGALLLITADRCPLAVGQQIRIGAQRGSPARGAVTAAQRK